MTNDDISKFATLFGDEFTLDHISGATQHVQVRGYRPVRD